MNGKQLIRHQQHLFQWKRQVLVINQISLNQTAAVYREQSYGLPGVFLCCTFCASMLHFQCQGAALFLALLFVSLYRWLCRKVWDHFFCLQVDELTRFEQTSRRFDKQISSFFLLIAALRSVSLRLQSLNQKTLTDRIDATESFHGSVFLFFLF